jgi:hypothetical protein
MGCCSESATHHLHDAPAVECPALRVIQAMSLSPELDLHTQSQVQKVLMTLSADDSSRHVADNSQDPDKQLAQSRPPVRDACLSDCLTITLILLYLKQGFGCRVWVGFWQGFNRASVLSFYDKRTLHSMMRVR